jgi:hypothetical protein
MKKEIKAMIGTIIKVFISSILSMIIAHGNIYDVNWKEVLGAGAISVAILLYNYFSPNDTRYGPEAKQVSNEKSDNLPGS